MINNFFRIETGEKIITLRVRNNVHRYVYNTDEQNGGSRNEKNMYTLSLPECINIVGAEGRGAFRGVINLNLNAMSHTTCAGHGKPILSGSRSWPEGVGETI